MKLKTEHAIIFIIGVMLFLYITKCQYKENFIISSQNKDNIGKNVFFIYMMNYFISHGNIIGLNGLLLNTGKNISNIYDFSEELKDNDIMCGMQKFSYEVLQENGTPKNKQINDIMNNFILQNNFKC